MTTASHMRPQDESVRSRLRHLLTNYPTLTLREADEWLDDATRALMDPLSDDDLDTPLAALDLSEPAELGQYLCVDASGSPHLRGADALQRGGYYRVHAFSGGGLMTEREFRSFASGLSRHDLGMVPSFDAPIPELVAWANVVGWRVLQLLGNNEHRVFDGPVV